MLRNPLRYHFIQAPLLLLLVLLTACAEPPKKTFEIYDGPMAVIENVNLTYSDSARLTMRLQAKVQRELKNKDRVFPKGMLLTYYDEKGEVINTLRADSTYHVNLANIWFAFGNVQLKNIEKKEILLTEELIWKPIEKNVETDKFVRIESPGQVLTGKGLRAKDDFSDYEVLEPEIIYNTSK